MQVGRPRPNFLSACFSSEADYTLTGSEYFTALPNSLAFTAECDGKQSAVDDAFRSFPSGHASMSAVGGASVTLLLVHALRVFRGGHSAALAALALAPLAHGCWVGLTRISDCAFSLSTAVAVVFGHSTVACIASRQRA